jgi:hypothetical protein
MNPTRTSDANLVITWSRNPHAKTPIPGKPSKSGLMKLNDECLALWNLQIVFLF